MRRWGLRAKGRSYFQKFIWTYITVLLIPIILIEGVNYAVIKKQCFISLEKSIRLEADKQLDAMDEQLRAMNSIVYDCRYSKLYASAYRANPPATYFDIMADLKKKEAYSPFFSNLYLYSEKEGMVLGSAGKYDDDFFFEHIVRPFAALAASRPDQGLYAVPVKNTMARNDAVAVVTPLSATDGTSLLFIIDGARIGEQLRSPSLGEGCIGVLEMSGRPVYATDATYHQALYESRAFGSLLDDKTYLHYSYSNDPFFSVRWAIPKLLFDRMLLGFVLIQAVLIFTVLSFGLAAAYFFAQRNYKPLKSLIQKARQSGAREGVTQDDLQYVDLVLGDLLYSSRILQETNRDLMREKLLYSVLSRQLQRGDRQYQHALEEGIRLDRERIFCVVFEDIEQNKDAYLYFESELSAQSSATDAYALYLMENEYIYLVCTDEDEAVRARLSALAEAGARLGVGESVDEVHDTILSYAGAKDALHHSGQVGAYYPLAELCSFSEAVGLDNPERAGLLLEELLTQVRSLPDFVGGSICGEIMRALAGDGELISCLQQSEGMDRAQLERIIRALYIQFAAGCEGQGGRGAGYKRKNVADIIRYIQEHYTEDTFSIKGMAAEFDITPSNLSHFFRKSTGQNISRYIESMKLCRAKEMLETGTLKVGEIAQSLGFGSVGVFIELFKKYEGVTPGAYRSREEKEESM